MIIVCTNRKFTVGTIINHLIYTDANGDTHRVLAAYVMREATQEEYIEFSKDDPAFVHYKVNQQIYPYFYQVSID